MPHIILFLFLALLAQAHQSKENYLYLSYNPSSQIVDLTTKIETKNFQELFELDDNANEIISYKELRQHQHLLKEYVKAQMPISIGGQIQAPKIKEISFIRLQDQTYMQMHSELHLASLKELCIGHSLFLDIDSEQRLFIHLQEPAIDMILSATKREYCFKDGLLGTGERFVLFVQEGISHILFGYDHLLFLLMLILPLSVLGYTSRSQEFLAFIKVITAFSISHSLTLLISAAKIYQPSVMVIESAISLSIMVVALLNTLKYFKKVDYKIAFAFGLLHGFGFANVLSMGRVTGLMDFSIALLGFNLGVELGQLCIVLIMFFILFFLARSSYYPRLLFILSLSSFIVASYWFLQRTSLI